MTRHPLEFRCELCRRQVDDDQSARAKRSWEPLIICDRCLLHAGSIDNRRGSEMAAVAAS